MGKSAVYIMLSSGQDVAITLTSLQQLWLSVDQSSQYSTVDRRGSVDSTHEPLATGDGWVWPLQVAHTPVGGPHLGT